jgi:hypothetical protein
MTVNDVTKTLPYKRRNRDKGGQRFLVNHVPLFLWQRFSDVIRRQITAAGLRYRYPGKLKLKADNLTAICEPIF